jgi:hypothetical protein
MKIIQSIIAVALVAIAINLTNLSYQQIKSSASKSEPEPKNYGIVKNELVKIEERKWISAEGVGVEVFIIAKPEGGFETVTVKSRVPENARYLSRFTLGDGDVVYHAFDLDSYGG